MVEVSKADALIEMARAYDNHEVRRSNRIGKLLSDSIRQESKMKEYRQYIELNKETKVLFPVEIRRREKK